MTSRAGSDRYEIALSRAAEADHRGDLLIDPGTGDSPIELTAFVSCYNESAFIEQTLSDISLALRQGVKSFEIIVIDDASTDDSAARIIGYIERHPEERIVLRRNLRNQGLSQNFIDGAFLGRGRYYKLFCGDNTEPPESIIKICSLIGQADIIIPHYLSVDGKSGFRKWLSNTYTRLVNLVSGNRITYYNGLHLHRRYNIMRWHPNTRGFGFQADIICMMREQGMTYLEVGVPAINRGASGALNWRNILSVGHTLTDIAIRRVARLVYGK
jgi:glycosyltransferase involved in cell wall biosynthesis